MFQFCLCNYTKNKGFVSVVTTTSKHKKPSKVAQDDFSDDDDDDDGLGSSVDSMEDLREKLHAKIESLQGEQATRQSHL